MSEDYTGSVYPPPPPPPPKRTNWGVIIIAVAVILGVSGIVAAQSLGGGDTSETARSAVPPTPDVVSCVDGNASAGYSDLVANDLQQGANALDRYDVSAAADHIRAAADHTRDILGTLHNTPEVYSLMENAAESYDASADDLEAFSLQSALREMKAAKSYVEQATALIEGGGVADCGDV